MSDEIKNLVLKEIRDISEKIRALDELGKRLSIDVKSDKYYAYLLGKKDSLNFILNIKI